MKTDTIKKEPVDLTRVIFKKINETILKDKNLIKEDDKENTNEKSNEDDKSGKCVCQLEKQTET